VGKRNNQLTTPNEFIVRHAQGFESFLEATELCRQYDEPSMVMNGMPSRVATRFKLRKTGSIQSNEANEGPGLS
jgi:hypothetical protein